MDANFLTENAIAMGKGVIVGGSGKNAVYLDEIATNGRNALLVVDKEDVATETHIIPVYLMQAVRRGESIATFAAEDSAYTLYRDWLRESGYDVLYINMQPGVPVKGNPWQPLPTSFDSVKFRDKFISVTASALVSSARSLWFADNMQGDVAAFTWSVLYLLYLLRCCGKHIKLLDPLDDDMAKEMPLEDAYIYLNDLCKDYTRIFKDASMSREEIEAFQSVQSISRTLSQHQIFFSFHAVHLILQPMFTLKHLERKREYAPVNDPCFTGDVDITKLTEKPTALFVRTSEYEASPFNPLPALLVAQINALLIHKAEQSPTGRLPLGVSVVLHNFAETMDYIYDLRASVAKLQMLGVHFLLSATGLDPVFEVYQDKTDPIIHSACVALMVVDPKQFYDKKGECSDGSLYQPWFDAANDSFSNNPPHGEWHSVTEMPPMTALIFPTPMDSEMANFYVSDVFCSDDHPSLKDAMASCIINTHYRNRPVTKPLMKDTRKNKKKKSKDDCCSHFEVFPGSWMFADIPAENGIQAAVVLHANEDVLPMEVEDGLVLTKKVENDFPIFGVTTMPIHKRTGILPGGKYVWAERGLQSDVFIRIGPVRDNPSGDPNIAEVNRRKEKIFSERAFRLRLVLDQFQVISGSDDEEDDDNIVGVKRIGNPIFVGSNLFDFKDGTELARYFHTDANGDMSFDMPGLNCNALLQDITSGSKSPAPFNCLGLNPFIPDPEYLLRLEIAPGRSGQPEYDLADCIRIQPIVMPMERQAFACDKAAYNSERGRLQPSVDKRLTFPYTD